jgi:hypothetical protein
MLGLHQPVQHLDELLAVEAGPPRGVQGGLQTVLHLAQKPLAGQRRVQRQDVGALAGDGGDEPLGGQLGGVSSLSWTVAAVAAASRAITAAAAKATW